MSFFNASNFAAPITNKTHLVTIVLVAALFGAFRWSQGRIILEKVDSRSIQVNESTSSVSRSNTHLPEAESYDGAETESPKEEHGKSTSKGTSLNDLISDQAVDLPKGSKAEEEDKDTTSSKNSLKDIEEHLGLR